MKQFALLIAVAALVAFSAATSQAGLVSLYTFDDGTDLNTIAANAVNTAYNGTAVNSVGTTTGVVGGAATFSGGFDPTTYAYINLPSAASLPPANLGPAGSFSVWGKGALNTGDYQLYSVSGPVVSGQMIHPSTYNGKFDLYVSATNTPSTGNGGMLQCGTSNIWPDSTNWHLVTFAWNYDEATTKGRVNIYIDGVAQTVIENPDIVVANSWKSNTTFGSAMGTGEHRINGTTDTQNGWSMTGGQALDDLGVWSNELAAAQAKALYNLAVNALDYDATKADALFNLYVNGGSAVIGGQTWSKYGTGTAFDGTGALTGGVGNAVLALGASGGVQIGVVPVDVTWTGGTSAVWDTAATGNWKKTSDNTAAVYGNGVAVLFNDTATGLTASINAADVSPASVTFNNSTNAYVVNGTKGIVGTTGVLKQGTAKVTLSGVNSYSGVTTLETTGGTLQFNKAAAWNPVANLGGANIKAGKMIFDYTGESSPAATIGALLKTSYNSASATHFNTGKFQSTTADTHHALGWKDAANQVTVAYTLYGDATVNGAVDISDLSALGQNWNGTGKVWAQGDFNYDGNVDISDLSALGQHWNQSIVGFSGGEGGAIVPEPSTLALLAAGLVGLLAYAWRKRK